MKSRAYTELFLTTITILVAAALAAWIWVGGYYSQRAKAQLRNAEQPERFDDLGLSVSGSTAVIEDTDSSLEAQRLLLDAGIPSVRIKGQEAMTLASLAALNVSSEDTVSAKNSVSAENSVSSEDKVAVAASEALTADDTDKPVVNPPDEAEENASATAKIEGNNPSAVVTGIVAASAALPSVVNALGSSDEAKPRPAKDKADAPSSVAATAEGDVKGPEKADTKPEVAKAEKAPDAAVKDVEKAELVSDVAESDAKSDIPDAETAKADIETAKTDAESAKADAQTVKTDAEAAKTDAESAKTDAESAKTDAESAKTDAESAKTDAEAAKAGVEAAKADAEADKPGAKVAKTDEETSKDEAEVAKAGENDAEMDADADAADADGNTVKDAKKPVDPAEAVVAEVVEEAVETIHVASDTEISATAKTKAMVEELKDFQISFGQSETVLSLFEKDQIRVTLLKLNEDPELMLRVVGRTGFDINQIGGNLEICRRHFQTIRGILTAGDNGIAAERMDFVVIANMDPVQDSKVVRSGSISFELYK